MADECARQQVVRQLVRMALNRFINYIIAISHDNNRTFYLVEKSTMEPIITITINRVYFK